MFYIERFSQSRVASLATYFLVWPVGLLFPVVIFNTHRTAVSIIMPDLIALSMCIYIDGKI